MAKTFRKRYIVGGRVQIRQIIIITLLILIFSFIACVITFNGVYGIFFESLQKIYPQNYLTGLINSLKINILFRVLFLTPVLVFIVVILSNKIAGPMYRINKSLDLMSDGDYSFDIKLRKRDEFKDLAARLNNVIDSIRFLVGEERFYLKEVEKKIEHLKTIVPLTADIVKVQIFIDQHVRSKKLLRQPFLSASLGGQFNSEH